MHAFLTELLSENENTLMDISAKPWSSKARPMRQNIWTKKTLIIQGISMYRRSLTECVLTNTPKHHFELRVLEFKSLEVQKFRVQMFGHPW